MQSAPVPAPTVPEPWELWGTALRALLEFGGLVPFQDAHGREGRARLPPIAAPGPHEPPSQTRCWRPSPSCCSSAKFSNSPRCSSWCSLLSSSAHSFCLLSAARGERRDLSPRAAAAHSGWGARPRPVRPGNGRQGRVSAGLSSAAAQWSSPALSPGGSPPSAATSPALIEPRKRLSRPQGSRGKVRCHVPPFPPLNLRMDLWGERCGRPVESSQSPQFHAAPVLWPSAGKLHGPRKGTPGSRATVPRGSSAPDARCGPSLRAGAGGLVTGAENQEGH